MHLLNQDSFDLPGDIPIETVDRIVPENFRSDKVVEVNNRTMFFQLIIPFFPIVIMLHFFSRQNLSALFYYPTNGSASFNLMDLS
jgi:hypothetical protein